MSGCEAVDKVTCSYVNVSSATRNATVFTWWMTLGRDIDNNAAVTAQFTVLTSIATLAIVANIIVLTLIFSNKKLLENRTHQYIAALSFDNLSFISLAPMLLFCRKAYTWSNSRAMCKSMLYIFAASGCSTSWTFVLISIERYIKIVNSIRRGWLAQIYPERPIIALAIVVVASTTYYIPLILYFDVYPVMDDECTNATKCFMGGHDEQVQICVVVWSSNAVAAVWFAGQVLFCYGIPLIFLCYNYCQVYITVRRVRRRIRAQRVGPREHGGVSAITACIVSEREVEIRVSLICALLVTVYIIMWTPIFIFLIITQFTVTAKSKDGSIISSDAFFWVVTLTLTNSAVNPVLYVFLNKKIVNSWNENRTPLLNYCRRLMERTRAESRQITPSETDAQCSTDSPSARRGSSEDRGNGTDNGQITPSEIHDQPSTDDSPPDRCGTNNGQEEAKSKENIASNG